MIKKKSARLFFIFLFIAVICIAVGFIAGCRWAYLYPGNAFNKSQQLTKSDLAIFYQAYDKLNQLYLGAIDKQKFIYGAVSGAFASLDDPYTSFLPPDLSSELSQELLGELEGIGVKIGNYNSYPTVIAPLKDSPAARAGLMPKDTIIKVDDFETKNQLIDLVVDKIRGPAGTKVKLEILRDGQPKTFEIERAKITVDTVELKFYQDTAYILINEFGINTSSEFANAVDQVVNRESSKIIIDLRNNPGGVLDQVVAVAGYLFPQDVTVVIEEGKNGRREDKTKGPGTLKNAKLNILVNEGSASASEILAGAVKDNRRGKVIGTKTFGKGTVQQIEPLIQGASIKVTVAKWLTPNGHNIDKNGILPDVEVKEEANQLFSESDPVLQWALSDLTAQ